jgi:hypothetical protein
MMQPLVLALPLGAALGGTAVTHHGWTGYDVDQTTTVKGTIRESSYGNPHATVKLQADRESGKTWTAVLAPPSRMNLTLVGYPSKKYGAAVSE